jgi:hypothetical protein
MYLIFLAHMNLIYILFKLLILLTLSLYQLIVMYFFSVFYSPSKWYTAYACTLTRHNCMLFSSTSFLEKKLSLLRHVNSVLRENIYLSIVFFFFSSIFDSLLVLICIDYNRFCLIYLFFNLTM